MVVITRAAIVGNWSLRLIFGMIQQVFELGPHRLGCKPGWWECIQVNQWFISPSKQHLPQQNQDGSRVSDMKLCHKPSGFSFVVLCWCLNTKMLKTLQGLGVGPGSELRSALLISHTDHKNFCKGYQAGWTLQRSSLATTVACGVITWLQMWHDSVPDVFSCFIMLYH